MSRNNSAAPRAGKTLNRPATSHPPSLKHVNGVRRSQFTVSLVLDSADRGINVGDRA
jgi:hypothetical protein